MAVLASDNLKKADCARCKVSQKQFDDLCASCYFTSNTQKELERIMDEENEFRILFWARVLAWAFCAVLCGTLLFLLSLYK